MLHRTPQRLFDQSLLSCFSHTRILRRGYSKVHRPSARPPVSTSFSYVQVNCRATMLMLGNCPQVLSEFKFHLHYRSTANSTSKTYLYEQKKSAFVYLGHKNRRKIVSFVHFARIASSCESFHFGTLHGYRFHQDFWPNLNFLLEYQIKLVVTCRYSGKLLIRCSVS